jgi:uncharacterized protein
MFASALFFIAIASAQVAVPPLKARVTDLTATLNALQRDALERTLAEFEARKGAQIAVLMVPTTQPETIEQYAVRVQEAWKLGRKGVDDSVLLVVAKDDRKVKIETGYGLEGILPDAIAKRIIEEDIVPRFKAGDFYVGIRAGSGRIMHVVEGEKLPPPSFVTRWPWMDVAGWTYIDAFGALIVFLVAFLLLRAVLAALGAVLGILLVVLGGLAGSAVAGAGAGYATWLLLESTLATLAAGLAVFALCLLNATRLMGSMTRKQIFSDVARDMGSTTWSGTASQSSSAGGGGDSGFSGGGGSSGGGGASGSW